MPNEKKKFRPIQVVAEATSIEKARKQVVAGQPGFGEFAFIADEGAYMPDGEGTAPTPLTYFTAGVALWLISQISQVAKIRKLHIKNERVKVTANFHEEGSVLKGDKHGECDGFEVEFSVDSEEPREAIQEMLDLAHKMCFTEAALSQAVVVEFTHKLNGEVI